VNGQGLFAQPNWKPTRINPEYFCQCRQASLHQDIGQSERTKTGRKRVAIDNVYAYLSYVQPGLCGPCSLPLPLRLPLPPTLCRTHRLPKLKLKLFRAVVVGRRGTGAFGLWALAWPGRQIIYGDVGRKEGQGKVGLQSCPLNFTTFAILGRRSSCLFCWPPLTQLRAMSWTK